uniref:Uncharacterized protein n=1 Tax=Vespula pensylvanica TaxID=30213 RepID=A0A834K161_VESPE|nr:hypothetical protein H0235_016226 [Vespula pensylvanica]
MVRDKMRRDEVRCRGWHTGVKNLQEGRRDYRWNGWQQKTHGTDGDGDDDGGSGNSDSGDDDAAAVVTSDGAGSDGDGDGNGNGGGGGGTSRLPEKSKSRSDVSRLPDSDKTSLGLVQEPTLLLCCALSRLDRGPPQWSQREEKRREEKRREEKRRE